MNTPNSGYEHALMQFYTNHLVLALPLTILAIKIIVRFVTREPAKDYSEAFWCCPWI
jgi:hypothetical protein